MDKHLAKIKGRILDYVDYIGISKELFYKKCGFSASNFKAKALESELGGEQIAKILACFPEIDSDWLITGEGEMLRKSEKNGDNGIVQIGKNSNNIVNTGTLLKNNANKSVYNEKKKECEICELCEAKERIIAEKNEVVEALKNQIELYKELLKK